MYRILCYGDSNTWGFDGDARGEACNRFDDNTRWPARLRHRLGLQEYCVVEEGLNGRTTIFDDPIMPGRNGRTSLVPCLQSHAPLDLVILMLGTNDLKDRVPCHVSDTARATGILIDDIRSPQNWNGYGAVPGVLLVSPVLAAPTHIVPGFDSGICISHSAMLPELLETVAKEHQVPMLKASDYAVSCETDGIHMTAEGHARLAEAVYRAVMHIRCAPISFEML